MNSSNFDKPIIYGVWIPGKGWLRGTDVFADYSYEKCNQVARLIGQKAVVRFIDEEIVHLENLYLEQERRSTWLDFKNYWLSKLKLSINNK